MKLILIMLLVVLANGTSQAQIVKKKSAEVVKTDAKTDAKAETVKAETSTVKPEKKKKITSEDNYHWKFEAAEINRLRSQIELLKTQLQATNKELEDTVVQYRVLISELHKRYGMLETDNIDSDGNIYDDAKPKK